MKCPDCKADNKEGAKFCIECGHKFELKCPQCGHSLPPVAKFCEECGNQLSLPSKPIPKELSFDEKLGKIQKYLPGGLTEKILAQRGKIEGERKQVTVMFTDMEGFTPFVEKLGPEEAYSIMDQVFELLIHKVHEYEGTVNKMTGDGIMALFGAPIALEDAPQRAIRSAHAIHQEMVKFSDKLKQEKSLPPIRMRIGIHTGPVVVGTLGNDLRVEFTAVGETVNLASRMEGLAEPGATYVTEDTFKLTEGLFRFEALGEKGVKGKEKPIMVYQVIAPTSQRTRFEVSAERGLTPFVGRARELELLLDGLGRAKEGRGQAFSIIGEAGVGKSRVLYEFRKVVASENITFLEGKCLSYGRGAAYHPISDILRGAFDIREGGGDSEIRERVQNGLELMKVDAPSALPYILELLSVKDSGIEKISMSPEGKKDRIIETLKQIILSGSEIRPLVMAIEDLHWADKSTEDVLRYLLEGIPAARVLLIFTYRPEFVHTWGGKSYHNQMTLNRLSNRESLAMAGSLLATEQVDRQIEELILARTEGVPFFIEEFIKSLKDLNIIRKEESKYQLAKGIQELKIPSTIQDMIMVRVDALPQNAKELLQTGSVIEREFSYELIKRVTGLDDKELFAGFSLLKDSELLYERGIFPQSTYIFKHALTREVVYDSLLAKKRKSLHEEIGKAIEEIYKDNPEPHYDVLAAHFVASENYERGAEYSKMAMRKAAKSASLNDAITHAKRRVACIEKMPQTDEIQRMRIDARTMLGLYISQLNYLAEAKEAIEPIVDLALNNNYKKRLCQIFTILGAHYFFVEEDYPEAFKVFEEALKLAEDVKDIVTLVLGSFWFGLGLANDCQFERAAIHYQKAIDINMAVKNLWGIASMKGNFTVFCHYWAGKIDLNFRTAAEALRTAEESRDILSMGIGHVAYGVSNLGKGYLEQAERYLKKGLEFCEKSNLVSWRGLAHFNLGETYCELGNFQISQGHYRQMSEISARSHLFPSWAALSKMGVAKAKVLDHEKDVDLNSLYDLLRNNRVRAVEGWMARYIGEILLNIDDQHLSEADHWIQKAIAADQKNGMFFELGRAYVIYADLFKRKGDRLKTQENLGKAIGILQECGADGWVEKYEKELASL